MGCKLPDSFFALALGYHGILGGAYRDQLPLDFQFTGLRNTKIYPESQLIVTLNPS